MIPKPLTLETLNGMLTCLFYSPIHTREREWISHDPLPRYGYHLYFDPLLYDLLLTEQEVQPRVVKSDTGRLWAAELTV